jgi:hypothetical protein
MKGRIIAIAALASSLIGGGALVATNAIAQATPPVPQKSGGPGKIERHPEIHKALHQLNNALNTMQNAADDFKGHKEDAMEATKRAIGDLNAALKADKT